MKNRLMNNSWESVYIYYRGDGDTILKELVIPYLNRLEDYFTFSPSFFFIRYFEDGYHIRLRILLNPTQKDKANQLLRELVIEYNLSKSEEIFVIYIPYIPEISRYGNDDTIKLAEQQFEQSSRTILNWLKNCRYITLSNRYLQALKLHIAFFKGIEITKNHAQEICDLFVNGWLPQLFNKNENGELQTQKWLNHFESEYMKYQPILLQVIPAYWDALDDSTESSGMTTYLTANKSIFAEYSRSGLGKYSMDRILGSFVHMTNNRLGISNRDEAFIIYLVKKCLTILAAYENNN